MGGEGEGRLSGQGFAVAETKVYAMRNGIGMKRCVWAVLMLAVLMAAAADRDATLRAAQDLEKGGDAHIGAG